MPLHFSGGTELGEEERIGEALEIGHSGLSFLEERHSVGSSQGFEHQVVVIGHVVFAAEQVVISVVIWSIRNYNWGVGMAGLEEKEAEREQKESRRTLHLIKAMWIKRKKKEEVDIKRFLILDS